MADQSAGERSTVPILHGRDSAVKLLLEFLHRPEDRSGRPRSRPVPVLVFTGTRGIGKTAFLAELVDRLDQRVPYADLDCGGTQHPSVRQMLAALVFELYRRCGKYGRLAFPRFITGQIMLAQEFDANDPIEARKQAVLTLQEHRNVDKLRETLATLAGELITAIPATQGIPGIGIAGRYLPELILKGLSPWLRGHHGPLREGQHWYGHQDRGLPRDPIDVLVELNRAAHHPETGNGHTDVADVLWAAFLADLRNAFDRDRKAIDRTFNCVLLLDNVDTPIGREFLGGLMRARRQHAAHVTDSADPLTVLAMSHGDIVAPIDEPIPTADEADYADYLRRAQRTSEQGWYPVALRELTQDEVGNMVAALGQQVTNPRLVTHAVHRFTRGHPASTQLILDAIAASDTDFDAMDIVLDSTATENPLETDPTTINQRLLDQFLPEISSEAHRDLVTCAAARNLDQALRLAAHSELLTSARGERSAVFAPALWRYHSSGATTVMPASLRRLLLRELARRPADDRANWTTVHRWLNKDPVETETHALYHALALGEVEFVTRRLAALLSECDVVTWLEILHTIARASNRLDHQVPQLEQVQSLTDWARSEGPPMWPLARLTVALWIHADPLGNSHRKSLFLEIAYDYDEIAPYSGNGLAALHGQAEKYRSEAGMTD